MSDTRKPHQAAKTTIVGGQPPGNDRDLATVPVGLEELLGMAAVDEAFERALLEDPARAAEASGVELTATEQAILASQSAATLAPMIARVRPTLPEPERRAFLEMATTAMAVLMGGGAVLAASGCDSKKSRNRDTEPVHTLGISPRRPLPREQADTGARPDRPPVHPTAKPDAGTKRPRPSKPQPTRGIRPRRPPLDDEPRITGIAPDRPKKPGGR